MRSSARSSSTTPRPRSTSHPSGEAPGRDLGACVAIGALVLVVLGSSLLVDPSAEASFDRPKRLVSLIGVALAFVAVAGAPRARSAAYPGVRTAHARWILGLLAAAAVGVMLATLASPRRGVSIDALRAMLVFALVLPLGASRVLDAGRGRLLLAAFLGASGVNALVSILQAARLFQPFALESVAGRTDTGAFIGNEGQLALLLAFAGIAALWITFASASPRARASAAVGALFLLWAVVVNRNLTALIVVFVGTGVLLVALLPRRVVLASLGVVLVAAAGLATLSPLRQRVDEMRRQVHAAEWDDLTSNRLGPWAAALEMARERPLTGWGPGTFEAEFVTHRLRAELRYRTRFVIPRITSSYAEAHSEYLQGLAEFGIPATAAAVAAVMGLIVGLCGLIRAPGGDGRLEALLLVALLGAGAAAALTWFPLERPSSAIPLLLAAGRAWRLLA